ncbi:MAG: DUF6538 domain-containing protein, partial [Pseudomonadota bacterium]|nr:DUF6538 domain-containing protein [Pseudomonadota bacterium]
MTTPYKTNSGVYYVRKKVPARLQEFTSKREIKKSLKTKSAHEAKLRYPSVMLEIDRELQLIEMQAQPESQISMRDIASYCDRWLVDKLAQIENDDNQLIAWFTQSIGIKEDLESNTGSAYDYWCDLVAYPGENYEERKAITASELSTLFLRHSLTIHEDSALYKRFSLELTKRYLELQKVAGDRLQGRLSTDPQAPLAENVSTTKPGSKKSSLRFSELVERWKTSVRNHKEGKEDSAEAQIVEYNKAFERFIAFKGDVPVAELTKRDVAEYRDVLYKLPAKPKKEVQTLSIEEQVAFVEQTGHRTLANNSVRKSIIHISALFTFACGSGYMEENVAEGVKPKRTQKAHVVDELNYYTDDDLKAIFSLPVFTNGSQEFTPGYGDAPYWAPLIMFYTG